MLGTDLSEFHSGYRAYRVAALKRIPFEQFSDDFDFDTEIIIGLVDAGLSITEIPIPTYYGDEICYVNGDGYARDVTNDVASVSATSLVSASLSIVDQRAEGVAQRFFGRSHQILEWMERPPSACSTSAVGAACSPHVCA